LRRARDDAAGDLVRTSTSSILTDRMLPVLVVCAAIVALWYLGAVLMNAELQRDAFRNAGQQEWTTGELVAGTLAQERPKLPAPHQVAQELWKTVVATPATSKRSLLYHAQITLSATLLGFLLGSGLGIVLAVLIVHVRSLDRSMMPWLVSSQTVPIIALAPMIVIILNQLDVTGIVPKAAIAAYLSFFPVTVGMVKGLRSPDPLQLDLMRTYSASRAQTFFLLRVPASVPFLFASLKVGVAASLVGAVVAELTQSADGGLGARLLAGSYYGQTIQIWAAIFMAALCACLLIAAVALADRVVLRRMGYLR
jgi:NitT/TauT family transport system permease protein